MSEYVNNKDFLNLLVDYRETNSKKTYEELGKIFLQICRNFILKPSFNGYTEDRKNEMISDATFYMIKYVDKFDLSKSNPFSYFTKIAMHAFIQNIVKYKKSSEKFVSLDFSENFDYVNDTHVKIDE